MYMVYLGVGILAYIGLALAGHVAIALFVLIAAVLISFYGGGFATAPAYLRDLFGTFQVGAIHGRLLTAWSAAGVAGPLIINGFLDAQGKPGTLTADAYTPALLTMVGVLAVGFVANLLVRPVADRFHESDDVVEAAKPAPVEEGEGSSRLPGTARVVALWAVIVVILAYGVFQTVTTAAKALRLTGTTLKREIACSGGLLVQTSRPSATRSRTCGSTSARTSAGSRPSTVAMASSAAPAVRLAVGHAEVCREQRPGADDASQPAALPDEDDARVLGTRDAVPLLRHVGRARPRDVEHVAVGVLGQPRAGPQSRVDRRSHRRRDGTVRLVEGAPRRAVGRRPLQRDDPEPDLLDTP